MAKLGAGDRRINDIADQLGHKVNSISPTRAKLIRKGMIYSPSYGNLAFTVPLFDEFMLRAMS
jgi:Mn-dependent DtxR family transcriptional regulator